MENMNPLDGVKNDKVQDEVVEEKDNGHEFTLMPDGSLSEGMTAEEYQEIKKDK